MKGALIELKHSFLELHIHEIQFAVIFGSIIVLFLIESFIPRRDSADNQTSRWLGNISIALFNHFLLIFYSILLVGIVSKLQPDSPILRHFQLSDISSFIIILLLMEFVSYWIHRSFHTIPVLWKIHAVHHSDTEVDVTTSHRHHPFEPMLSALVITPIVFVMGAPVIVIVMYNLTRTAVSVVNHGNFALPERLDNILRLLIITPDFHRMHHSSDRQYSDSNYGAVVPWFDYLFKTATSVPYDEIPKMELGLETLRELKDNRLDKLLLTPITYKPKKY